MLNQDAGKVVREDRPPYLQEVFGGREDPDRAGEPEWRRQYWEVVPDFYRDQIPVFSNTA